MNFRSPRFADRRTTRQKFFCFLLLCFVCAVLCVCLRAACCVFSFAQSVGLDVVGLPTRCRQGGTNRTSLLSRFRDFQNAKRVPNPLLHLSGTDPRLSI